MRSDEANLILGQRVNTWVSILVFLLGLFLWRHFGRMPVPERPAAPDGGAESTSAQPDPAEPDAADAARTAGSVEAAETVPTDEPAQQAEKGQTAGSRDEDLSVPKVGDEANTAAAGGAKQERPSAS
jgi:hypothetical protein